MPTAHRLSGHPAAQAAAAPALIVASATSLYSGAAVAISLFTHLSPVTVAWLRVAVASVVLLVLFRPRRELFVGTPGRTAVIFGLAMVGMNMCFYEAIGRIPMGTAVAIEFLGPAVVAALGSRTLRDWLILAATVLGVVAVSGAQWQGSPLGVLFALGAATGWALYIIAGVKIANAGLSNKSLGISFLYAAVLTSPVLLVTWPGWTVPVPTLAGMALALAVLSTVLPAMCDQQAMRIAGRDVFSVLSALYPVTAAVLGWLVLHQSLTPVEICGIGLVVVAVALRKTPQRPAPGGRRREDAAMPREDPAEASGAGSCSDG
ncbi:EamA family transporter [Corynebacterium sp. 13CS0277]|uniref:EamA family transporter n=1 Tax=Corynebacterium sp. 13CS0277 TaxID=2071994 RepID=UPI000D046A5A|nr:EamA family transporter [Corynebacterium sp. 13CS0277]PRQ11161.1 EamA family transporter [Corynebacterium sp. 13CS0277]